MMARTIGINYKHAHSAKDQFSLMNDKTPQTTQYDLLLKGGHLPGNDTIDILHDGDKMIELPGHRIQTRNTHGTGCTLSAALAALLPQMDCVVDATRAASRR